MLNADYIKPSEWTNVEILYDDGDFSAISGKLENESRIGMKWNSSIDCEIPKNFNSSEWFVLPTFLTENVLLSLLRKLQSTDDPECILYRDTVLGCLETFFSKPFLK